MRPSIPDRWMSYKACGNVIEGTRIICFKVPLKKSVQAKNKKIKQIWDINTLLRTIENLGAVVDLTNTSRYYNPRELQAAGVLHKKILMPGRIIPPENKVKEFMDAVDDFLGKDRDFLIGVHCTHGLNRTGYMVCRYMRDRLGISAQAAIKRFEIARGYQMERENYINHLLGNPPTEPDLSQHTDIKPVNICKMQDSFSYQSPIERCDYEDQQRNNRLGKRKYESNSWRQNDDDRIDNSNWRRRESDSPYDKRARSNWRNRESNTTNDDSKDRHNWKGSNVNTSHGNKRYCSNRRTSDSDTSNGDRRTKCESDTPYDFKYDY